MARGVRIDSELANKKKKLHFLQGHALAKSKLFYKNHSVRRNSIILGCLLYICKLKLKLEAVRREYLRLTALKKQYLNLLQSANLEPKVMVTKAGRGYYEVKVTCERKEDMLVSTLEAFEIVGLEVLQARVSSGHFFSIDAFTVTRDQRDMDANVVIQAILKALEKRFDGEK